MKRFFLILAIFLFLLTTPVLAKKDSDNKGNSKQETKVEIEIENECDPSDEWKNHGQYVSCVAKLKQGGAVVSAAAKSDISKLASESLLGKKSEASPAPEASPSPSPSAKLEIGALIEILNNLIKSLQNLMTN